MKVKVLTFHCALSYGAVLQAYALCRVMKDLGADVEIVNFRPYVLTRFPATLRMARRFKVATLREWKLFGRFERDHLPVSSRRTTTLKALRECSSDDSLYVVGSDQVWNPDITKEFRDAYFLGGVGEKKISYAASFGNDDWEYTPEITDSVARQLNEFSDISVREIQGQEICWRKFKIKASLVLDPTLLLNDYSELITKNVSASGNVVCYILNVKQNITKAAKLIGGIVHKEPVCLAEPCGKEIDCIRYPSVETWLSYMRNASFVITDSFHGLTFSLLFNKQFLVVAGNIRRLSRVTSLLSLLGLEDRMFVSFEEMCQKEPWLRPIDYAAVNSAIASLRESSFSFLQRHVSSD